MMQRITLLVTLLAVACLFTLPAMAQTPPPYVNVVDYGATPDANGNDDAPAIEAAIGAACSGTNQCRAVYFPKGEYAIQSTINLTIANYSVKLFGTGVRRAGSGVRPTQISWNGSAGGVMVEVYGVLGLHVEDICFNGDYGLDGTNKAGLGFDVRYYSGYPSGECHFQRVALENMTTGFECRNEACNADMTFIDLSMGKCNTGFHTLGNQNVNFTFIRPEAVYDTTTANTIGFYFELGGSITIEGFSCGQLQTSIKIAGADVNDGNFIINGWKPETYTVAGKRMQLLDASGWNGVVQVNGLCTGTNSELTDTTTPLFKLGKSMTLQVNGSQIFGSKIATIGDGNSDCWATFDSCKFGRSGDPRMDPVITHDAYSGYELRNCELGGGIIPNFRHDHSTYATPLPATNLASTAGGAGTINLTWTDNATNETSYSIYMCTDNSSWNQNRSIAANSTSYSWTGLTPGITYYFKVTARNSLIYSADTPSVSRVSP